MFILGKLIIAIAEILKIGINIFYWLLIIRVVISWLPVNRHNQLVILLENLTDPVLQVFRRFIPVLRPGSGTMGFDFTPLVAILALFLVDTFIVDSLLRLGSAMIH